MSKNVSCPRFHRPEIKFRPEVDLQEVDQFGFVNLAESYSKGIIPGGISLTDESFSGVSNPGTLISRSQDVFDGLRKVQYVKSQLDRLNAEEREKVERQLNNQSQVTRVVQPEA